MSDAAVPYGISLEDEKAQHDDEVERLKPAQSEQLKSILDDAEARIRATGGIKHEDFWKQMDAEYHTKND